MDLWDVVKLMARRWYVAAPMLLVTLVAALWVTAVVKPDYEATTNVTLLPPTVRNDSPTSRQQTVNPWDTESLTVATLTFLNSKRLHDQMAADGFSEVWAADTDIRFRTLIIIKVTASGADKAQATAKKLQELVTAEVARQQERYNLKPGEEITTIPFDNGDNLETKTSKAKRALIVVVGVGFILTVAFTVGLDALLRWRAGRRRLPGRGAPAQLDGPTVPVTNSALRRALATPASAPPRVVDRTDDSSEETRAIILTSVKAQRQPENAQLEDVGVQEDATIVLPLSNTPWMGKGKGKGADSKSGDKATENGKR